MAEPLTPDDPSFPPALLRLREVGLPACPFLYRRGAWPPPAGIAVVGTRHPTEDALAFTRALARAIAGAGWAVWSGGARGIDAAAHRAALDHGGTTVVVTPSGFDRPYPPEHAELFARVVDRGGALVTPFPEDAAPILPRFLTRNAVLAALTLATVVVQAGRRSGARSTARAARKLARPLYVVPHAPWDERGEGCALELQAGARAIAIADALVTSLRPGSDAQLAIAFGGSRDAGAIAGAQVRAHDAGAQDRAHDAGAQDRAHVAHASDPVHARVLDAIGQTPIHTDDLCERTALPSGVVAAALLTLTLQAVVVEAPAGFYRRSTR